MARIMLLLLFVHAIFLESLAVRVGDEEYSFETAGTFWVYADRAIHHVDAATLEVLTTIQEDHQGKPLTVDGKPTGQSVLWYDAVYVESQDADNMYILINEGDVYTDDNGEFSYVNVLDVNAEQIVNRIRVSPNPVHLYAVPELGQVWTHSDKLGAFDVIFVGNLTVMQSAIPAKVEFGAHGKLLWDKSLFPYGYATNVAERFVYKIDLISHTMVRAINISESWEIRGGACVGFHGIQYSSKNRHLYLECVRGGGIVEFDTADEVVVAQWPNSTGSMAASPFENYVVAVNKGASMAHIFLAGENHDTSSERYHLNVPGNPGAVEYYPNNDASEKEELVAADAGNDTTTNLPQDYWVFFPLTRNTNMYNRNATEALGLDPDNGTYPTQPFDCKYENKTVPPNYNPQANGIAVKLAAGEDGKPLTPECGSCAPMDPEAFDAELSGVAYINLRTVIDSWPEVSTATLIPAGAVKQGTAYTPTRECQYSFTYRKIKRGGQYLCTPADFPQPSIYCIDGAKQQLQGYVETNDNPKTIVYAPPRDKDVNIAISGRK